MSENGQAQLKVFCVHQVVPVFHRLAGNTFLQASNFDFQIFEIILVLDAGLERWSWVSLL